MMTLFKGLGRAYGVYALDPGVTVTPGAKVVGKPKTVQSEVNEKLWQAHLDGTQGVGIVPIMDNCTCYFGAIDIDIYSGFDTQSFIKDIYLHGYPVIPIRSKSGGLHLYMFLSEAVSAKLLQDKLKMIASYIGHSTAEIFPKQTELLVERGDIGGWINMPYYEHENTERYAYSREIKPLLMSEFIAIAMNMRLSKIDLERYTLNKIGAIEDGPPCLQSLITKGFSPGSRNNCMFNIGVYLKQSNEDNYEGLIDEYNQKYCDPKLSSAEIQNIIGSLKKRSYFYTCDKSPFKDHCDKTNCKLRKYGVGSSLEMPKLTNLTKFNSNPPIWFVDVEDAGRLELTTEDIQSQSKFQRKCMEAINQMPPPVKPPIWNSIIQNLLENVTIIEVPETATPIGLFYEYLEKFCTSRAQGRSRDELLLGKPFTEDGRHYFRLIDLMAFLERNRFKDFKVNKITSMIQEIEGKHNFFRVKDKGVNVWSVPEFKYVAREFDTPPIEEKNVI